MINIARVFFRSIGRFFLIQSLSHSNEIFRLINIGMIPEKRNAIVTYQIIGLDKIITKNLDEVYEKDVDGFCKNDAKYIGFLHGKLNNNTHELLRLLPANSNSAQISFTPKVVLLCIISTSLLILSNLVGPKILTVSNYEFNAGLLFFPAILVTADITTEVYGFRASRLVIWLAFLGNILTTLGTNIVVALPHSEIWRDQQAYETVFNYSTRTLIASGVAFLTGEFINSYILCKLKILTMGRFLWLRAITSTAIGTGFDNFIFYSVAFYGIMPTEHIISIGLFGYVVGILYEILMLPVIYLIVGFLKKSEKTDVYDFNTNFSPFII